MVLGFWKNNIKNVEKLISSRLDIRLKSVFRSLISS